MPQPELNSCTNIKTKNTKRYYLLTIACGFWLTILMGIVFAFWAQDVQSYLLVMCVFLVMDVVRNAWAHNIYISPRNLKEQYELNIRIVDLSSSRVNLLASIHYLALFMPILFSMMIIFISYGDYSVGSFVDQEWMEKIFPYFGFMETHAGQLIDMGYSERVSFVLFVYLVNIILFLIGMIFSIYKTVYVVHLLFAKSLLIYFRDESQGYGDVNIKKNPKKIFIFSIFIYLIISFSFLILNVGGGITGGINYNVQTHEWPFIVFSIFLSGLLIFGNFAYEFLMRMRMDACGLWQQLIDGEGDMGGTSNG